MEYNSLADRGKYLNIYNYISETPEDAAYFVPDMLVKKIRQLNAQLMIPESLGAVGVTEEHLEDMADDALKSGNIAVNPRKTEKKDILELYRRAM
jgi:alcohol dehydrogenase